MRDGDVQTRMDVYRAAIENFREFSNYDPMKYLSARMGLGESTLYQKVHGERTFSVLEEETFFSLCEFPQGFVMKMRLVFKLKPMESCREQAKD